ncbi:MAG: hypothetical protein K6G17_09340 [Oscillospiraceae bacterium]|nr:hypothetical protein [Oscillospiraceae bacterium]
MTDPMKAPREESAPKGHRLTELFHKSDDPLVQARQKILLRAAVALCVCLAVLTAGFRLTAAWYTNVVKTGEVMIQADTWGFDGEITVPDSAVTAYPGDSGDLSGVSITNNDSRAVDVRMDVNRSTLTAAMQKRLFLYTLDEQNHPVWLNSQNCLRFSLDAGDSRSLDDVHWMWVYDLLGYTLIGTSDGTTVSEEEILSPVEYTLEDAVFDDGGALEQLSSTQTAAAYIQSLLDVGDTYSESAFVGGYYPLRVDENGHGVWLYLLSWSEIEAAAGEDTQMAQQGANFTIELDFVGQNARS